MKRLFKLLRLLKTRCFNKLHTGRWVPYRCQPPSADQIEAILKALRKSNN